MKNILCPKCDGGKTIEQYKKIKGGKCFTCNGKGFLSYPDDKIFSKNKEILTDKYIKEIINKDFTEEKVIESDALYNYRREMSLMESFVYMNQSEILEHRDEMDEIYNTAGYIMWPKVFKAHYINRFDATKEKYFIKCCLRLISY